MGKTKSVKGEIFAGLLMKLQTSGRESGHQTNSSI